MIIVNHCRRDRKLGASSSQEEGSGKNLLQQFPRGGVRQIDLEQRGGELSLSKPRAGRPDTEDIGQTPGLRNWARL